MGRNSLGAFLKGGRKKKKANEAPGGCLNLDQI